MCRGSAKRPIVLDQHLYTFFFPRTSVAHCERHRCEPDALSRRGSCDTLRSLKPKDTLSSFLNIRVDKYPQMQLRHRTSSSRGCRSVVDASILFKQGNARNLSYCTCSRCTEKTCYFILSGVLGRLANVFLFRCKHAKCLYTFSKNCA